MCIPQEKTTKALQLIEHFLNRRKATVLDFQRICGTLNFLCKCIVPGRPFLRRLYIKSSNLKQHHHVNITAENKMDLRIWQVFLNHPTAYCRPFIQKGILDAKMLDMYSDASRNFSLGFSAYCGSEWTWGQWDKEFCEQTQPSIEYLELFAVTVAVMNWLRLFPNRRIILFCDNQAVVNMINNNSSSCKNCMVLIRFYCIRGTNQKY